MRTHSTAAVTGWRIEWGLMGPVWVRTVSELWRWMVVTGTQQ